jgi:signal peptidase I
MLIIIKKMKITCIPLLCGMLVVLLFRYVFIIGYVPSASMEPTIPTGSYILGLRIYSPLHPGDIVVFQHDRKTLVKRISTMPGDTVRVQGTDIAVPEGCFYLLGDSPAESVDSRHWAEPFIRKEDILAVLLFPDDGQSSSSGSTNHP